MLASTPRWAGRSTVPAASTTSPARTSSPARRTASPAATVLAIRTRSPVASVSSTMTTASAPVGHRRTGHDAQGLARLHGAVGRGAGGEDADGLQLDRGAGGVGGPHGVAVDGGVVERRHRLGRHDVGGQDAAEGVAQGDGTRGERRAGRHHQGLGVLDGDHRPDGTGRGH